MKKAWSLTAELKKQLESLLEDWIEADKECREYNRDSGEYWEEYRRLRFKYLTEEENRLFEERERHLEEEREKACQRKKELERKLKDIDRQLRVLPGE